MTRHRYKKTATRGGSSRRVPESVSKVRIVTAPRSGKHSGDRTPAHSEKKKLTGRDLDAYLLYPDTARLPAVPGLYVRPADMPEAKERAIEAIRRYGVLVWASRDSGIGRKVLYQLMREEEGFRLAMQLARKECFEDLEASMIARGHYVKGDLAGIFTLKHNNKKYREVSRVELSGPGGTPIAYEETKSDLLSRLGKLTQSLAVDAEVRTLAAGSAGSGGGSGRPALVPPERPIIRKLKKGA